MAKCFLLLPFSSSIIISDKIWRKSRFHFLSLLVLPQISFVKYYETIKILMQIFEYFRSHFHNEGGDCEKSYFEVFFWQWSHLSLPKISTFTDPPFTFFAHISLIFDKYQMPIFFIEYLGSLRPVRTWLMYIWSKLSKN